MAKVRRKRATPAPGKRPKRAEKMRHPWEMAKVCRKRATHGKRLKCAEKIISCSHKGPGLKQTVIETIVICTYKGLGLGQEASETTVACYHKGLELGQEAYLHVPING